MMSLNEVSQVVIKCENLHDHFIPPPLSDGDSVQVWIIEFYSLSSHLFL